VKIGVMRMSHRDLVSRASVDLDEPLSWHPALRADTMAVGEFRPLDSVGKAELRGLCRSIRKVSCNVISVT